MYIGFRHLCEYRFPATFGTTSERYNRTKQYRQTFNIQQITGGSSNKGTMKYSVANEKNSFYLFLLHFKKFFCFGETPDDDSHEDDGRKASGI